MEFKDFLLKDLFVADKGDVDLQQKDVNGKGHYLINSGVDNFGIKGRTDRPAKVFPANTITIDFWGNAYYRDFEYKMATHNHVFSLSGDIIKNREVGLFLVGSMASFPKVFSYSNMATWPKLKEMTVSLPVREDGTPDCDYMAERVQELEAERVQELEAERVQELEAYLTAVGLTDYELTEADKQALGAKPNWHEFRIGDLFEPLKVGFIGKGKKIGSATKAPDAEHSIPLTCAKIGDNGIMYWGKPGDFITYTNALSVIADGAVSAGLVYAQPEEAGAYSHSYFIKVKDIEVSKYVNLFLSAVLTKVIYPKYSRENAPRWNKISQEVILLPVKSDRSPDWDYMEQYICATEKNAIADAVNWKDTVIAATKSVVA